ncbi:MAG: hypothetical protein QM586_16410 [Xenophilus sp.]
MPLPLAGVPRFDAAAVLAHWPRLHAGQPLPPPADPALAEAWALYHGGDFAAAATAGLALGDGGANLADQATAIYANYVEPREATRLALLRQVGDRAQARALAHPEDCQALYWHAYALGRHAQAVSVARALAQGLGGKLKEVLERIIELEPRHADAHFALGAFHAEVIDKVGALVGRMTYGVRADTAVALFERGLEINPHSATGLMEYARALLALEGDARAAQATRLYERAAAIEPADARERLDAELARTGLHD